MDKETKPTLSIIMPTFNHEEELAVMIDSIKCNTYDNWELLAIDDGSEESTISLLQRYAQEDSRIRLICRSRLPKGPLPQHWHRRGTGQVLGVLRLG